MTFDSHRFCAGFSPSDLLEESAESFSLESFDRENGTEIREFIQASQSDVLEQISIFCMEDSRLWDVYWKIIYEAASEVKLIKEKEAAAIEKEEEK